MLEFQPYADEWADEHAVFSTPSREVLLTQALEGFLIVANEGRRRPVLLTDEGARVSALATLAMRRFGGLWAVRTSDGVFDALGGHRIRSFKGLWDESFCDDAVLPAMSNPTHDGSGVLMFDVFVHQRAVEETRIGHLAESLFDRLGGGTPQRWDRFEPLLSPWDVERVTSLARLGMPQSDVMRVRSDTGGFGEITVARTERGILEQAKGGVLIGEYDNNIAPYIARAGDALAHIADRFHPTIGFVSYAHTDAAGAQEARSRPPEVPLAVVIGPRGVRDLGVDFDEVKRKHDVVRLGRARVPSLLVRFSREDEGLWRQLAAFVYDLGLEKVLAAAKVDGGGPDAH